MSAKAIAQVIDGVMNEGGLWIGAHGDAGEAREELAVLRDMARVLTSPGGHDRDAHKEAWARLQALAKEGEVTP